MSTEHTEPLHAAEQPPAARAAALWRNFERFADALSAAAEEPQNPAESSQPAQLQSLRSA